MNPRTRRHVLGGVAIAAASLLLPLAPVGADEGSGRKDDNIVVVVNQTNDSAVADSSLEVRFDRDGTVDQENRARALANCVNCMTAAIAMQLVVVTRPPLTLTPVNEAYAVNVACSGCLTYASATQIIVGTDGPAYLTREGRRRIKVLQYRLKAVEKHISELTPAQLHGEVSAIEAELLAIAQQELRTKTRVERDDETGDNFGDESSDRSRATEVRTTRQERDERDDD